MISHFVLNSPLLNCPHALDVTSPIGGSSLRIMPSAALWQTGETSTEHNERYSHGTAQRGTLSTARNNNEKSGRGIRNEDTKS